MIEKTVQTYLEELTESLTEVSLICEDQMSDGCGKVVSHNLDTALVYITQAAMELAVNSYPASAIADPVVEEAFMVKAEKRLLDDSKLEEENLVDTLGECLEEFNQYLKGEDNE